MKKIKKVASKANSSASFTKAEITAMRQRAKELKEEARLDADRAEGERVVLAKINSMKGSDRVIAQKLHEIIKANAPVLSPKLWYGMPAYARDGKVVCFFQYASKFKARYATLGFNDAAHLDQGNLWSTTFGIVKMTPVEEAKIKALVKKAVR